MTCGPLAKWQQSFGSGEQHEVSFGLGGGGKAHLLTQQDVAGRGEVGEDGRYCNGGGRRGHRLVQTCIFSRQVWSLVLQQLGLLQLAPQPSVTRFSGWWKRSTAAIP